MISALNASNWVQRWETQQERYVADREERFAVICDVVDSVVSGTDEPLVLDLGCGPGSLSARVAGRIPGARVIGVDADPLLVTLARVGAPATSRFVEADLGNAAWVDALGLPSNAGTVDAAVSTTALHWLPESQLAALYRDLAMLLRPGGVLANGDYLQEDQPTMADLAGAVRAGRARRHGVPNNEDLTGWWDAARADAELGPLVTANRKADRGAHDHHRNGLSLRRHAELLIEA
ncbi:MAG TPA: class I SAM-dependent methyltransferase, partial [Pseudonocardiaceae bacterium]|nr:class I SAM-dependent methyltransferase [Pseudonocardiaceae bacterium]